MPTPAFAPVKLQDHRLRYLHLSHEKGSMRAAAEELGVATSSVSRQIARLEEELGIALVEQGTHRICLTAAGQVAVDYYAQRVAHYQALIGTLDGLRERQNASTVIAIGEGLLGARAIHSLQEFLRRHDDHQTEIISAPSLEVQRMVAEDEAHLGVVFSPSAPARLTRLFSLSQPLRLIVHRSHALAERTMVSLQDVAQTSLALPGARFRVRELIDAASKAKACEIVPSLTSNSLVVLLDYVRSGLGATLLAELPIIDELKSGTLRAIAIDCEAMQATDIQIVTRRARVLGELDRALAHEIAKAMRMAL